PCLCYVYVQTWEHLCALVTVVVLGEEGEGTSTFSGKLSCTDLGKTNPCRPHVKMVMPAAEV
ncbi:hypothetical protein ACQP3J_29790, partial [Escherichia coli]